MLCFVGISQVCSFNVKVEEQRRGIHIPCLKLEDREGFREQVPTPRFGAQIMTALSETCKFLYSAPANPLSLKHAWSMQ